MKTDLILKLLIQVLTNCNVGEEIPSIKTLSDNWNCSRGIIQSCFTLLQDENAIELEKSKSGTKLKSLNISKLRTIFFNNELKISLPLSILNNEDDYYILNNVNSHFKFTNASVFTSFESSPLQRTKNLLNNLVHMAVITDVYFDLIDSINYKVLTTFEIKNPSKLSYVFTQLDDDSSQIEELNISYQNNFTNTENTHIKLYKPTKYFVITKTENYNLLNSEY